MPPKPSGEKVSALPLLDLDALVEPVAQIKRFEQMFDVMPIDGASEELFAQMADRHTAGEAVSQAEQMQKGDRILAQVVPDMTPEHRKRLSTGERLQIIMLAATQVERVRDFIRKLEGNGRQPAPKGRASARSR